MSAHIENLLSAYMDNELTENERGQVDDHLSSCPECSSVLRDLIELQAQLFMNFQSIEEPETLEDTVLQAIGFDHAEPSRRPLWLVIPLFIPLMIMAIAFAFTGTYVMKLGSIGFKVCMKLIYTLGSVLGADPYILIGLSGFSLLLMIGSGFSLKYLLKTKAI